MHTPFRRIDEGLARSHYGIVILSPNFLAKQWPQRELNALTTRELGDGDVVVLPVWHQINRSEVAAYSLPLADRVAAQSKDGIDAVVDQIIRRIGKR
ncbi:MAG: TIR domain-containing protein [Chromatiales bacterium]